MDSLNKIKDIIEPIVLNADLNLYDISFCQIDGQKALQVIICHPDYSMDMDTCETMSDLISTALDKANIDLGSYMLDVCSPGCERELKTDQQINQAVDQYIHVNLLNPQAGIDQIEGYLRKVEKDLLQIEYKEKTRTKGIEIKRDNISLIRLAVKL